MSGNVLVEVLAAPAEPVSHPASAPLLGLCPGRVSLLLLRFSPRRLAGATGPFHKGKTTTPGIGGFNLIDGGRLAAGPALLPLDAVARLDGAEDLPVAVGAEVDVSAQESTVISFALSCGLSQTRPL